jgi:CheY-like chemotaxis protein
VLSFSRGGSTRERPLDLNWLLADTARLLRRLIGRNIDIACDVDPKLGAVVADPAQLEQVIVNLAVNARDAMPTGGRLSLAARNRDVPSGGDAEVPELQPGRYVELCVSDSGCGMPDDTRRRAFEPFFTTKTLGRGNGLGLASVARVAAEYGGAAVLESEEGKGTSVRVMLPRRRCVEARRSPAPACGRTSLVVDPDPVIRALLRNALELEGLEVIEACDASTAVASARDVPVDLLVTDLGLPYQKGHDLRARLSEDHPELRVLYLAPHSECEIRKAGGIARDEVVARRPAAPRSLARAIHCALPDVWSARRRVQMRDVISSDALRETGSPARSDTDGATFSLHRKLRAPHPPPALGKAAGL